MAAIPISCSAVPAPRRRKNPIKLPSFPRDYHPHPLASHHSIVEDYDVFWHKLVAFHGEIRSSFTVGSVDKRTLDLHQLYREVTRRGGYNNVVDDKKWKKVAEAMHISSTSASTILNREYAHSLYLFQRVHYNPNTDSTAVIKPADATVSQPVAAALPIQAAPVMQPTDSTVSQPVVAALPVQAAPMMQPVDATVSQPVASALPVQAAPVMQPTDATVSQPVVAALPVQAAPMMQPVDATVSQPVAAVLPVQAAPVMQPADATVSQPVAAALQVQAAPVMQPVDATVSQPIAAVLPVQAAPVMQPADATVSQSVAAALPVQAAPVMQPADATVSQHVAAVLPVQAAPVMQVPVQAVPAMQVSATVPADNSGRKKRKRRSANKSAGLPKKRRSGYNFFIMENHSSVKAQFPNNKPSELLSLIALQWNRLTPVQRTVYQRLEYEDDQRHLKEVEDYKKKMKASTSGPQQFTGTVEEKFHGGYIFSAQIGSETLKGVLFHPSTTVAPPVSAIAPSAATMDPPAAAVSQPTPTAAHPFAGIVELANVAVAQADQVQIPTP